MSEKNSFLEHIKKAHEEVSKWPDWRKESVYPRSYLYGNKNTKKDSDTSSEIKSTTPNNTE